MGVVTLIDEDGFCPYVYREESTYLGTKRLCDYQGTCEFKGREGKARKTIHTCNYICGYNTSIGEYDYLNNYDNNSDTFEVTKRNIEDIDINATVSEWLEEIETENKDIELELSVARNSLKDMKERVTFDEEEIDNLTIYIEVLEAMLSE